MIQGHGGNIYQTALALGCQPDDIMDMSSNLNPLGPPPALLEFLKQDIGVISRLPEVDAQKAVEAFGARYHLNPENILANNGTTQAIYSLPRMLKSRGVLIIGPTYADYADACRMHGIPFTYWLTRAQNAFQIEPDGLEKSLRQADTVFICNPNNPTGSYISRQQVCEICRRHPETNFIIDESYLPFLPQGEDESMMPSGLPNVVVLSSMSKIFSIPGLRIGFLVASSRMINRFRHFQLPWTVNSLAQAAVSFLSENKELTEAYLQASIKLVVKEREFFMRAFNDQDRLQLFRSATSFILIRLTGALTAEKVCERLARKRLLIRNCSNFEGLNDQFIRVSLKQRRINTLLIETLRESI